MDHLNTAREVAELKTELGEPVLQKTLLNLQLAEDWVPLVYLP